MAKINRLQLTVANVLTALASPPERRTEPDGADVSKYQGLIDWNRYLAHPYAPQYVILRATIGSSYLDSYFDRNRQETKALGLKRAYYFVTRPNEPYLPQLAWFDRLMQSDPCEGPPIHDFELSLGQPPAQLRQFLYDVENEGRKLWGRLWHYTAKWFMDGYVTAGSGAPAWYGELWWHLAQYLRTRYEHPGPVALPAGVPAARVVMHQTTDKAYGKDFGMSSEEMDYNRLLLGSVDGWFGPFSGPIEEPAKPAGGQLVMQTLRMVNFRTQPNTGANIIRVLQPGECLPVVNVAGPSAWVETVVDGERGFVAAENAGIRYLEPVGGGEGR